jgi:hypothetical protein
LRLLAGYLEEEEGEDSVSFSSSGTSLNFSQSLSALVFYLVPSCHLSSVRSSLRNIANSFSQLLHTSYLHGQHDGEVSRLKRNAHDAENPKPAKFRKHIPQDAGHTRSSRLNNVQVARPKRS